MLILGSIVIIIFLFVILGITYKALKDLNLIKVMSNKRKIVYLCTKYENIFDRFILPTSFLLMKNRGDNLCKFEGEIEYIDYGIDSWFM